MSTNCIFYKYTYKQNDKSVIPMKIKRCRSRQTNNSVGQSLWRTVKRGGKKEETRGKTVKGKRHKPSVFPPIL